MAKPLLIGEANPYGSRPEYALYPEPEGASGDRLCRLVMGLDHDTYLDHYDRVNLCPRDWSTPVAKQRAADLLRLYPGAVFVLLGAKVTRAFGLEFQPFTGVLLALEGVYSHQALVLPHPSGRNLIWNETGSTKRARDLLRQHGALPARPEPVLE